MNNILEIHNLKYKNLFDELNMSVEKNTISIISGPNNCGKTTLARILNKEIKSTGIRIKSEEINNIEESQYKKYIEVVIPKEIIIYSDSLEKEINVLYDLENKEIKKNYDYLTKIFKIKKLLSKNTNLYTEDELIIAQIILALMNQPLIIVLDNIREYLENDNYKEILNILQKVKESFNITIIITTNELEDSLNMDQLYIINGGKIELEGKPIDILQKDNIINKIGLNIPFMVDLSVKLRDYDLIKSIELDYDRMVESLWK